VVKRGLPRGARGVIEDLVSRLLRDARGVHTCLLELDRHAASGALRRRILVAKVQAQAVTGMNDERRVEAMLTAGGRGDCAGVELRMLEQNDHEVSRGHDLADLDRFLRPILDRVHGSREDVGKLRIGRQSESLARIDDDKQADRNRRPSTIAGRAWL
jgi:hypothetical protein